MASCAKERWYRLKVACRGCVIDVLGAAQSHTLWEVMLGVGAIVVVLVVILMRRLVAFLKVFEARAAGLLALRKQAPANLAPVEQLAATGRALEELKEALPHDEGPEHTQAR